MTLKQEKEIVVYCNCCNAMNLCTCMYGKNSGDLLLFIEHVDFREVQTRSKFSGDHWDVPNAFLDRLVQESLWIVSGYWWASEIFQLRTKCTSNKKSEYCTFIHTCDLYMQYQIPLLSVYIHYQMIYDVGNSNSFQTWPLEKHPLEQKKKNRKRKLGVSNGCTVTIKYMI